MKFKFVDEILKLVPGVEIEAVSKISSDEDYFPDHFPGFPVVPGTLLTEMMGQAAGQCLYAENADRGRPVLVKIRSATFRGWVEPDCCLILRSRIKSSRPQFGIADCSAEVDGKEVCAAELFFSFVDADKFAPDYCDEVLEHFLERNFNQNR